MKKNFKKLEVGHYYLRQDGRVVQIVAKNNEFFTSDAFEFYMADGRRVTRNRKADWALVTEVTITPVESPKPRECWVAMRGLEPSRVVLPESAYPGPWHSAPPTLAIPADSTWVRMREVLDDEGEET